MRNIVRKITSVATAAALALTLNPASALAHEQTNATIPLAASTATGQSAGSADADASGAALPYASARANSLSVDAPLRVTFEGAGNAAYDVNNKAAWGTPTANVTFTNWHSKNVYLAGATVKQTADANVGNVFTGSVGLTLSNGSETATTTLTPSTSSSAAMQFGSSADAADQERVAKKFKVAKDASGTGTSATFSLTMDATNATPKSTSSFDASALEGNVTDIAKLVWTFAVSSFDDPTVAEGTPSTAADGFYLQIAANPVSAALQPYKGNCYSLEQVRTHSKLLGSGETDANSDLYQFYYALTTSMAPEGDYACYVKYNNADWPVRIIGLNQDVVASDFDEYRQGDLVGLTFQFRDLIATSAFRANSTVNTGGWGGTNAQDVRNALNTDGEYYNNMTIKDSIVPVKKFYSSTYLNGSGSIMSVTDKMFLASYYELTGNSTVYSAYTWIPNEGAGRSHNEQYLFYQNKSISGNSYNYKWLVKSTTRDWATSKVTTTTGGNSSTQGTVWWERSVFPGNKSLFFRVNYGGSPIGNYAPSSDESGICPCFCL